MTATEEIAGGATLARRYRVLRRIGSGGMATVFLAEDDRLGREVAIKRLHTDAPKASLRRFSREARLGAALNHPNFVAVYDTVLADEGALIVMEHVPGSSLAELAADGRMAPDRAVPILRSVADALDHAHAQRVVHRDVKPANVLVRDDGVVKLADLGIARAIGATQITGEGSVIGTVPYMAPERLAAPGAGGPASDVYSLAAVAYELLSGRPPTEASSTGEAAAQPPPDLAREWPEAPAGVAEAIERGLDHDPGRRQGSAGQLVDGLEAGLSGEPVPETAPFPAVDDRRTVPLEPSKLTRTARRFPSVGTGSARSSGLSRGAAIAVLALALVAVGAAALGSGGGDDDGDSAEAPDAAAGQSAATKAKEPKPEKAPEPTQNAAAAAAPTGAELNDIGFNLIEEARYEEAVGVLQRAVDSFPPGTTDITYAYALYNLGHALRLAGRPEEAIPILQQRLEFPNQRGEVLRELEAAMADAGLSGDDDDEGPGNGNGKAKGRDQD